MRYYTSFDPMTDRYEFDFKQCTYKNGWVQCDTYQDASYFGIWANLTDRKIVTYAEGDITRVEADDDAEFRTAMLSMLLAYDAGIQYDGRWRHAKIDPGLGQQRIDNMRRAAELGLAAYLH